MVRWPECDRDSDGVGEFVFNVGELGRLERESREPDVCESVAPCNDCSSSRRKDWRRFNIMDMKKWRKLLEMMEEKSKRRGTRVISLNVCKNNQPIGKTTGKINQSRPRRGRESWSESFAGARRAR